MTCQRAMKRICLLEETTLSFYYFQNHSLQVSARTGTCLEPNTGRKKMSAVPYSGPRPRSMTRRSRSSRVDGSGGQAIEAGGAGTYTTSRRHTLSIVTGRVTKIISVHRVALLAPDLTPEIPQGVQLRALNQRMPWRPATSVVAVRHPSTGRRRAYPELEARRSSRLLGRARPLQMCIHLWQGEIVPLLWTVSAPLPPREMVQRDH